MRCSLGIDREPFKNAEIAKAEWCLLQPPGVIAFAIPKFGNGTCRVVLVERVAIATLDEGVQSKADIVLVDSTPDFQRASRDAVLLVLDCEKDVTLYEATICGFRVIGELRKFVDPSNSRSVRPAMPSSLVCGAAGNADRTVRGVGQQRFFFM
jgi:hypothetical protein